MSSFSVEVTRFEDRHILKSKINLRLDEKYDYCSIVFQCHNITLNVLSTSHGEIIDDKTIIISSINENIGEISADLEYCTESDKIECLAGYYVNKKLINYDSFFVGFDNTKNIKQHKVSTPIIATKFKPFKERMLNFNRLCENRSSPWEFKMSCPNDIILAPISKGQNPIIVSFGEVSDEVLASDYLFSIDNNMNTLHIPRSILNAKYPLYSLKCDIGIFELVQPDFISVNHLYKKVLISNIMNLSEFANKL